MAIERHRIILYGHAEIDRKDTLENWKLYAADNGWNHQETFEFLSILEPIEPRINSEGDYEWRDAFGNHHRVIPLYPISNDIKD